MIHQQWPRGCSNQLHVAAAQGCIERTIALLSRGCINIDQGDPSGFTPLMFAAQDGQSTVARILLNRGANVFIVAVDGITALHLSAQYGHLAVTVDLVKAGANVDASDCKGATPLHLAANHGHSEMMAALIEAGADINNRRKDGITPLYIAAMCGHLVAVKQLLCANANPLLAMFNPGGLCLVPLDTAAKNGRSKVVHELIQQVGIEGCGGESGGATALAAAALGGHVDVLDILMDAGVVNTGKALLIAVQNGREAAAKLLLQQRCRQGPTDCVLKYLNFCDPNGLTPLFVAVSQEVTSPKVVGLLIIAGADTSSAVRSTKTPGGDVIFNSTPLAFIDERLRATKAGCTEDATEEHMFRLEAVRRLLLRVDAAHAVSWLWPTEPLLVGCAAEVSSRTPGSAPRLALMLPILRRRRRGVLLRPMLRYSSLP